MNWPQFLLGAWLLGATLVLCACTGGGEAYQPTPAMEAADA